MKDLNSYFGKVFEGVAIEFLIEMNKKNMMPIEFMELGRWWHRTEEIDIVTLNKDKKEISFFECKWRTMDETEAMNLLSKLEYKASLVNWHNNSRKERYGIIAKNLTGKEKLRENGFLVFDIEDMMSIYLNRGNWLC